MGNSFPLMKRYKMSVSLPVVVILGCTGTGKSKLALQLAKKFNGEIISADSMQLYKGLDIITNKVENEEQKEIAHHFISCIEPPARYTVIDFRNRALPIINNLLTQNKLPIIVGGTYYYIESLLWDVLIKPEDTENAHLLYEKDMLFENTMKYIKHKDDYTIQDLLNIKITQNSLNNISNSVLHRLLMEIDPEMANSLHPQDRRKVIRSLQVYQQYGSKHSDMISNQKSQQGGSSLGGPLRYKNSVMLWLQCEKQVLENRLDDRVDKMIEKGLIEELLNFHKHYNETRINNNTTYTEGIFQSIGFKEFHEYLILPNEEKSTINGRKMFEKSIEEMKLATKKYAKKQIKWIKNRFLKRPDRQVPPVYGLDATNLDLWNKNVLNPAIDIVQCLIEDKTNKYIPIPIGESIEDVQETHYCETCEKIIVGRRTWKIHLNSKKHNKRKQSLIKKEVNKKKQKHNHNCNF